MNSSGQKGARCLIQWTKQRKNVNVLSWSRLLTLRYHRAASNGPRPGCPHITPVSGLQAKLSALSVQSQIPEVRHVSTGVVAEPKPSLFTRLKESLGFQGDLKHPQAKLAVSGVKLYMCCSEAVDYNKLFDNFDLADSFSSWFILHELHVWLCMVRLLQEGRSGVMVRDAMIRAMWKDVKDRSKTIGKMTETHISNKMMAKLGEQFRMSLLNYDEGLLGNDQVLASAVWRAFFEKREVPLDQIELMVHYIRKQVHHLGSHSSEDVLDRGIVTFLPLHSDKLSPEILQRITSQTQQSKTKIRSLVM